MSVSGSHSNGNGSFNKWAVAILTASVIGGGGWAFVSISELKVRTALADQRLAALDSQLNDIDTTLNKLDGKLEQIQATQQRLSLFIAAKDNPELLRAMFPTAHP